MAMLFFFWGVNNHYFCFFFRNANLLIPNIFNFLVLLSYERYHTKTIIQMPKVIQLCDGIMASGQDPTTHGNTFTAAALFCVCLTIFYWNYLRNCGMHEAVFNSLESRCCFCHQHRRIISLKGRWMSCGLLNEKKVWKSCIFVHPHAYVAEQCCWH